MENLHFILNNILTKFFKELTKYKNDYQQYLNYIYKSYYASYCISLNVFMHIHEITSQFILNVTHVNKFKSEKKRLIS